LAKAARAQPAPFAVRVAAARSISEAKELAAEAAEEVRRAKQANDAAMLAVAIAQQMAADRRGGLLLLAATVSEKEEVSSKQAARWRRIATLTAGEFSAAVAAGNADAERCESRRGPVPQYAPQIRTVISAWSVDETGCLARTATAVNADAMQPAGDRAP
jgi:hypothetical protein